MDPPYVKELCRLRSLCIDAADRRAYSFDIFHARAAARREWRKNLVCKAAHGHWESRRLLHKHRPLPVATRPLLDRFGGDPIRAATVVQQHFGDKFTRTEPSVPTGVLDDLDDPSRPFCPKKLVLQWLA